MSISVFKKLASDTAIYGIGSIGSRLLSYVFMTPFLTTIFPQKAEYGIVSTMYAYSTFLMIIFTYRMETAFFRFGNKEENREKALSTTSIALLLSTIFFVLLTILLRNPLSNYINYPENPEYVVLFAFILGFDALAAVPFANLRLANRPMKFATLKLVNVIATIVFTVFLLSILPKLAETKQWAANIYYENRKVEYVFIANLLASALVLLCLLPDYLRIKYRFDKALFDKMIRYAAPLILVGFAGMINEVFDRIMLSKLLPGTPYEVNAEVGVYSACYKIATFMTLFIQAFNYATEPFFFKNADKSNSKVLYGKITQVFTIVSALAFVVVLLYLDILKHLVQANYWVGLGIVPILLLANVFLGLYYNFSTWFKLADKTAIGSYITVGGAFITLVLNFILIPLIGYMGAAWTTLVCYFYQAVITYWYGQRYYPIKYPIKKMILYILAAMTTYFLSEIIRPILGDHIWLVLIVNTFLLCFFVLQIVFLEKSTLKKNKKTIVAKIDDIMEMEIDKDM